MNKILMVLALVMMSSDAFAQAASYGDVIKTCGAEWRERSDKATNTGRDAWNKFRVDCVARKGYQTKAQKRLEGFTRVPDAAKTN